MKSLSMAALMLLVSVAANADPRRKGEQHRIPGEFAAASFTRDYAPRFVGVAKRVSQAMRGELTELENIAHHMLQRSPTVDVWTSGDTTWYRASRGTIRIAGKSVAIRTGAEGGKVVWTARETGPDEFRLSQTTTGTSDELRDRVSIISRMERGQKGVTKRVQLFRGKPTDGPTMPGRFRLDYDVSATGESTNLTPHPDLTLYAAYQKTSSILSPYLGTP
jgi:hypothetical protein